MTDEQLDALADDIQAHGLREQLDALADDIKAHGLREPIETLAGQILDGRNRYRACLLRAVKSATVAVSTDDPVAYVLSKNLHRRHLTPSQMSMVGARVRKFYDQQAKERQKRKPADSVQENLPEQKGQARDQAGKAVGVSGRSIDFATRVLDQGTPELVQAVDEGRMAVTTAASGRSAGTPPHPPRHRLACDPACRRPCVVVHTIGDRLRHAQSWRFLAHLPAAARRPGASGGKLGRSPGPNPGQGVLPRPPARPAPGGYWTTFSIAARFFWERSWRARGRYLPFLRGRGFREYRFLRRFGARECERLQTAWESLE